MRFHSNDPIQTILVDDDAIARTSLRHCLQRHFKQVDILGEADRVDTAIKIIDEIEPDLVFLDINLPDGTGFDIIEETVFKGYQVIFTTAFDQFAFRAFEFSALHYLLKPVKRIALEEALKRFNKQTRDTMIQKKLSIYKEAANGEPPEKMIISSTEGLNMVKIDDIIRCEADDAYTSLFLITGKKITVSKSLAVFEKLLEGRSFSRIHNKHLIHMKYIKQYQRGKGGSVIMEDGTEVEVSVRKKNQFMEELKNYALST